MTIYRTTTVWSGFSGAPGYTNFYFQGTGDGESVDAVLTRTHAFWNEIKAYLPGPVTLQVSGEVARIDETTGMVEAFLNGMPPASVKGVPTGNYAGPSGACVTWSTGAVRNGRRVKGRTFIVPLANAAFDSDGTLGVAALGDLNTAATAMRDPASPNLGVWSRPSARGAADGIFHFVTGHRITDKAAVLRSRRD